MDDHIASEHTALATSICYIPNWTPTQATVAASCARKRNGK